jgi:hypothetical protein
MDIIIIEFYDKSRKTGKIGQKHPKTDVTGKTKGGAGGTIRR